MKSLEKSILAAKGHIKRKHLRLFVAIKEATSEISESNPSRAPANPAKSILPPYVPVRCHPDQTPRSECRRRTIPPHRRKSQRRRAGPDRRSAGNAGPAAASDLFPVAGTARASCWKFLPTT